MTHPAPTTTPPGTSPPTPEAAMPEPWKPEPRQWQWKDLFTAPMLAFKPTCMVISALTIAAIGGIALGHGAAVRDVAGPLWWVLTIGFALAALVVFALGATLVSVFLRADLIDDEFLSVKEAAGQYAKRILPAIAVPLFLVAMGVGVNLLLLYLPLLAGSTPYAGGMVYALLYPFAFVASLIAVLFGIALILSLFVFPGIVATRQHGWFDNVVDTVEAIGTKPHVLVGGLVLTLTMAVSAYVIGQTSMHWLGRFQPILPGDEIAKVELRGEQIRKQGMWFYDPLANAETIGGQVSSEIESVLLRTPNPNNLPGYYLWGPGLIAGIWKVAILSLLLGYCLNLVLSGGLLTYLLVREDDYWDDEDLEDLDQLAKELEEEAARETAAQAPAPEAPKA